MAQSTLNSYFYLALFYMCLYDGECICHGKCVWRSENIFVEDGVSIHPCKWAPGIGLGSPGLCHGHFYPLSHLAGPVSYNSTFVFMYYTGHLPINSPLCCTLRLLSFGRLRFVVCLGVVPGIESKVFVSKILSQNKTLQNSMAVHAFNPGGRWSSVGSRPAWLT